MEQELLENGYLDDLSKIKETIKEIRNKALGKIIMIIS